VFRNQEGHYRSEDGPFAEFPVDYEHHHYLPGGQNTQGHAKLSGGALLEPGIGRVITNHQGDLRGYNYHPEHDRKASYRATEHYKDGRVIRYVR